MTTVPRQIPSSEPRRPAKDTLTATYDGRELTRETFGGTNASLSDTMALQCSTNGIKSPWALGVPIPIG